MTAPETMTSKQDFSSGFDSGNYANAYTSETLDSDELVNVSDVYRAGYVLGFFSSYELDEVDASWREEVGTLRQTYSWRGEVD